MRPTSKISSRILDRYILDGERLVVATRHHWAKLIEPVLTTIVVFLLLSVISDPVERASSATVATALWWIFLAVLARLVWRLLEWRNEWFVATDKRLLMTYGLITHKVAMMPLRKVTDLNYSRSPVGRVLGYGEFLLESAGQDQAMREIEWLPSPDATYRAIVQTIFGPAGRDPDEDGPDPLPVSATMRADTTERWDEGPGDQTPWDEGVSDQDEVEGYWDEDWSSGEDDPQQGWQISREDIRPDRG